MGSADAYLVTNFCLRNNSGNVVIDHRRWEPVSAVTAASLATVIDVVDAAVDLFRMPMLEHRKTHGDSVPTTPIDDSIAATEGMLAVPQLWGESVEAHNPVEDWHSGFKVPATSFTDGISGAVTGLCIRTIEGKKRGGTMGAIKGLGQGTLGFATKSTGAIAGLVTYPAQGLSRSISGRGNGSALQEIMEAIWAEAQWMHNSGKLRDDVAAILKGFEAFKRPRAQEV